MLVDWMHVTHSDHQPPNSLVLSRISDRRAWQWWDPYRLLAKIMARDFPPESAYAMADTSGAPPPLIWDLVAMWRPGVTWTDRLPWPDFHARHVAEAIPAVRQKLGELSRVRTK